MEIKECDKNVNRKIIPVLHQKFYIFGMNESIVKTRVSLTQNI